MLLADEVYQTNIWDPETEFNSFKKVASDMGVIKSNDAECALQLMSFNSVSKGFFGECGRRGGYVEMNGFDQDVMAQLYKIASVSLCSNILGQVMVRFCS